MFRLVGPQVNKRAGSSGGDCSDGRDGRHSKINKKKMGL